MHCMLEWLPLRFQASAKKETADLCFPQTRQSETVAARRKVRAASQCAQSVCRRACTRFFHMFVLYSAWVFGCAQSEHMCCFAFSFNNGMVLCSGLSKEQSARGNTASTRCGWYSYNTIDSLEQIAEPKRLRAYNLVHVYTYRYQAQHTDIQSEVEMQGPGYESTTQHVRALALQASLSLLFVILPESTPCGMCIWHFFVFSASSWFHAPGPHKHTGGHELGPRAGFTQTDEKGRV
jgi:hypothetical protein